MIYVDVVMKNCQILELPYPFTEQELKSKFRVLAKKCHPDVGSGINGDMFVKIKDAYDFLKAYAKDDDDVIYQEELAEEESLKPGYVWERCSDCVNGVQTVTHTVYKTCTVCDGSGNTIVTCSDCKGTGKFTLRSGRIVGCRRCGGTGEVQKGCRSYGFCLSCYGMGTIPVQEEVRTEIHTTCKGHGRIQKKQFNPVFWQGGLK